MYDCMGRPHHVLYEDAPIDNILAAWMGFESAWTLTAIPAGSFACFLDGAARADGENSAMALRHVRHITSMRYSGSITGDVYEVSKTVHSGRITFGESK